MSDAMVPTPAPTAGSVIPDRFPPHSRYATSEVVTATDDDREQRRYLRRRFITSAGGQTTVAEHLVVAGDRLDTLAFNYLGDPLLSWRIADANVADDPAALVDEPGRVLRICAPDTSSGFGGAG